MNSKELKGFLTKDKKMCYIYMLINTFETFFKIASPEHCISNAINYLNRSKPSTVSIILNAKNLAPPTFLHFFYKLRNFMKF